MSKPTQSPGSETGLVKALMQGAVQAAAACISSVLLQLMAQEKSQPSAVRVKLKYPQQPLLCREREGEAGIRVAK